MYAIGPFAVPDVPAVIVTHGTSAVAAHEHVAPTVVLNEPPPDPTACVAGLSVYAHDGPVITTLTSFDASPAPHAFLARTRT